MTSRDNCIKSQSNKPDFNTMALFYKGYSEYCLENYKDSYSTFVRFGMEGGKDNLKYVRSAYEFASKCALQNGEYPESHRLKVVQVIEQANGYATREEEIKANIQNALARISYHFDVVDSISEYDGKPAEIINEGVVDCNNKLLKGLYLQIRDNPENKHKKS